MSVQRTSRILIVDLANFAYYPTLAVGYLVALLREGGFRVDVFSPLSVGVPSAPREFEERLFDYVEKRISYSTRPGVVKVAGALGSLRRRWRSRANGRIRDSAQGALEDLPDAIFVSTYTDSYPVCVELGRLAQAAGIPLVVGGPALNDERIAREWLSLPGLAAVVGAEVEPFLVEFTRSLLEGEDLASHPGVFLPSGARGPSARPLKDLDRLPFPDFTDFPWQAYPTRVVPILTGRGCGWGKCRFCGDVVTANGRTYRSRSPENVLAELEHQARLYATRNFTFLDLKLNSNLELWHALIDEIPRRLPGARWIATVHVEDADDNGLDAATLHRATAAGLTRVTFGLESASQRLLDAMDKGSRMERNQEFLRDAHAAGLSARTTVIQGWPGESAAELAMTADFLERNAAHLDRVRLNRFNALPGARFEREFVRDPEAFAGLSELDFEFRYARSSYRYAPSEGPDYRRAMARLVRAAHRINRRPLRPAARQFDGIL